MWLQLNSSTMKKSMSTDLQTNAAFVLSSLVAELPGPQARHCHNSRFQGRICKRYIIGRAGASPPSLVVQLARFFYIFGRAHLVVQLARILYIYASSVSPDTVSLLNVSTRFYLGVHAVRNIAILYSRSPTMLKHSSSIIIYK